MEQEPKNRNRHKIIPFHMSTGFRPLNTMHAINLRHHIGTETEIRPLSNTR